MVLVADRVQAVAEGLVSHLTTRVRKVTAHVGGVSCEDLDRVELERAAVETRVSNAEAGELAELSESLPAEQKV